MMEETISFDLLRREPLLIVISGPSGVGKDSVIDLLRKRNKSLRFVITAASRAPREGEKDGVDYFFVSSDKFRDMIKNGDLIEHAMVYGEYKGIPKKQIIDALESGNDIVMRVDVQGASKVRSLYPEAVLIFLIPGSQEEWTERLISRRSESQDKLKIRLSTAKSELNRVNEFDYIVVNPQGRLEDAVETIEAIIVTEHSKVEPRKINI